MDLVEFKQGFTRRHPWETARLRHFARVLSKAGLFEKPVRALDVGSGDAWFAGQILKRLPAGSTITCWDQGYDEPGVLAAVSARADRGLHFTKAQPEAQFDLITMMDVLEHVEDDRGFLSGVVQRNLAADGRLLLSVPAWPSLFSGHDHLLFHFRRYRPAQIETLMRECGLRPLAQAGLFGSLLAFRALELARARWVGREKTAKLEDWRAGPGVTRAVEVVLDTDARVGYWLGKLGIDFSGLSWWALCRKP